MPDHDDLHAGDLSRRFELLSDAAVPALPGAAAARARGAQRTRRARAALVSATAVATVLAVGAGVSLAGGGGPDRETLPPASPAPSTAPSADASSPATAALLREQDAEVALVGEWQEATSAEVGFALLPAPCAEAGFGDLDSILEAQRRFAGPEERAVTHLVHMYADDAAAQRAWGTLVDDVEACPAPPGVGDGARVEVVGGLRGTGPTQAYVRQLTTSTARAQGAAFAVLVQGAVLSVVQLIGPTADLDAMPVLADLARERAKAALPPEPGELVAPPPPPPAPESDAPFAPSSAFLSPEEASAAEQPGWEVDRAYEPEAGPLLDPCRDGAVPLADDVTASDERAMGSRREVGGSGLQQEVWVYGSTQAAREAVAAYARSVERCPSAPAEMSPPDHTVQSSLLTEGSARLLVRQRACAPTCNDLYTTYALVAQAGRGVTVATYAVGEDGDPVDAARALLDAVAARLAEAAGGPPLPSAEPVYFRSPTGAISCSLGASQASCDITGFTYEPPPRPADCDLDWGGMVVLDAGGAKFVCHGDTNRTEAAQELAYGDSLSNGTWTCTSRESGMTCREVDGDEGFTLSRSRYELR